MLNGNVQSPVLWLIIIKTKASHGSALSNEHQLMKVPLLQMSVLLLTRISSRCFCLAQYARVELHCSKHGCCQLALKTTFLQLMEIITVAQQITQ